MLGPFGTSLSPTTWTERPRFQERAEQEVLQVGEESPGEVLVRGLAAEPPGQGPVSEAARSGSQCSGMKE